MRVTSNPIARDICQAFGKRIVSTSANFTSEPPVKTVAELNLELCARVDMIVEGDTGELKEPTRIVDALTQQVKR